MYYRPVFRIEFSFFTMGHDKEAFILRWCDEVLGELMELLLCSGESMVALRVSFPQSSKTDLIRHVQEMKFMRGTGLFDDPPQPSSLIDRVCRKIQNH